MLPQVWMRPCDPPEILVPFQNDRKRRQGRVQGNGRTPLVPNALKFASCIFLFELMSDLNAV